MIEQEIKRLDELCRKEYAPLDTFFVESMACDAGIARGTLQNRISAGDQTVAFIVRFDYGFYGSCVNSMQAYGEVLRRSDRRRVDHTRWTNPITDCGAGSCMVKK